MKETEISFEETLARLFQKVGCDESTIEAIRSGLDRPYELWEKYRRFPEDTEPSSTFFNRYSELTGHNGTTRAKRSYLHMVFKRGRGAIKKEAKWPQKEFDAILKDDNSRQPIRHKMFYSGPRTFL